MGTAIVCCLGQKTFFAQIKQATGEHAQEEVTKNALDTKISTFAS